MHVNVTRLVILFDYGTNMDGWMDGCRRVASSTCVPCWSLVLAIVLVVVVAIVLVVVVVLLTSILLTSWMVYFKSSYFQDGIMSLSSLIRFLAWNIFTTTTTRAFYIYQHRYSSHKSNHQADVSRLKGAFSSNPRLIVLDLDGNLWRPEMYELTWDGYNHSPFTKISDTKVKSQINTVVSLIGDVAELLDEFVLEQHIGKSRDTFTATQLAISSRTDVPIWAKELLSKFTLPRSQRTLQDVITGPWEISYDRKVIHFQRLTKDTGIPWQDMVFFDNEYANCQSIAQLGVTVGYCPQGITRSIWESTMKAYPNTDGTVIEA
jgi:magnesium-dependent phosphatase 1